MPRKKDNMVNDSDINESAVTGIDNDPAVTGENVDVSAGDNAPDSDDYTEDDYDVKNVLAGINEAVDNIAAAGKSADQTDGTAVTGKKPAAAQGKAKKTTVDADEMIPCRSLFFGKLIYTSPTNGAKYIWKEHGAVVDLPFSELKAMNNHKPQYLNKPFVYITVAEVVEYFNLLEVYKKVRTVNRLKALFNTADLAKIRRGIRDCIDVGQKDAVVAEARKMRKDGTLTNINVINLLKDELKFDIG